MCRFELPVLLSLTCDHLVTIILHNPLMYTTKILHMPVVLNASQFSMSICCTDGIDSLMPRPHGLGMRLVVLNTLVTVFHLPLFLPMYVFF